MKLGIECSRCEYAYSLLRLVLPNLLYHETNNEENSVNQQVLEEKVFAH